MSKQQIFGFSHNPSRRTVAINCGLQHTVCFTQPVLKQSNGWSNASCFNTQQLCTKNGTHNCFRLTPMPKVGLQHCGTSCKISAYAPHPFEWGPRFLLIGAAWEQGAPPPTFQIQNPSFYLSIIGSLPERIPTEMVTPNTWKPQLRTACIYHVPSKC